MKVHTCLLACIAACALGCNELRKLDEKVFRENYASFPVDTQVRKNIQKEKRYGHRGVPAVIVNGKYLVSASLAGSNERMIQIMNFLVAHELAQ